MAPKQGGRSKNFAIITDGQWKMELPSLLEETGSELTLLEQGMRCLHDSIAATNKEYLEEVELCTLLTTVVENIHAVSHFKHETFTALQFSQDFGTITKETLQKTTMAFESIKLMQPLPSAEISAETETAMKEEDEYDTASDNDISDTEEEISPVAVSRSGRPMRAHFRLDS